MRKLKTALLNLTISFIFIIFLPYLTCQAKEIFLETNRVINDKLSITQKVSFMIQDQNGRAVEKAEILLIGNDGKVIEMLRTDKRGMTEKHVHSLTTITILI